MAKIPFGILGPVIGSIGPVTGKNWKGIATLSSHRKPAKTDKDPTPNQLNQREKFGFVSKCMNGLGPLVKKTFRERRKTAGQIPLDLLVQYINSTFILVLNWWVENKCPLPPKEVDGLFRSLIVPVLKRVSDQESELVIE